MNELRTWSFGGNEVRITEINGEPWWVLSDICEALDISNASQAASRLKSYESGICQIYTSYGNREVIVINESGLYKIILRSDKPKAEPFFEWITQEVLPAIRKTGKYVMPDIEEGSPKIAASESARAYAYLQMAKIVSQCKTDRLTLVLDLFREGGWEIPDQKRVEKMALDTSAAGQMINEVLEKYNMNLYELARVIKMPYMTLVEYARRGRSPSSKTFVKLRRALDKLRADLDNNQAV